MHGIEAPIGTREGRMERFALLVKSWNLHQAGQTVLSRDLRKVDGRHPQSFPHVEGADLSPE